jgi:NAD(P)-dependent dehydrogenase (short-subunit alcohol dehydrogenase family)
VKRIFSEIRSRFGRLDVVVNCAGIIGKHCAGEELSSADLDKVMDINYRGLWLCEKAAIRQFLSQEERPVTYVLPQRLSVFRDI